MQYAETRYYSSALFLERLRAVLISCKALLPKTQITDSVFQHLVTLDFQGNSKTHLIDPSSTNQHSDPNCKPLSYLAFKVIPLPQFPPTPTKMCNPCPYHMYWKILDNLNRDH